jgi:hypothetical protein
MSIKTFMIPSEPNTCIVQPRFNQEGDLIGIKDTSIIGWITKINSEDEMTVVTTTYPVLAFECDPDIYFVSINGIIYDDCGDIITVEDAMREFGRKLKSIGAIE